MSSSILIPAKLATGDACGGGGVSGGVVANSGLLSTTTTDCTGDGDQVGLHSGEVGDVENNGEGDKSRAASREDSPGGDPGSPPSQSRTREARSLMHAPDSGPQYVHSGRGAGTGVRTLFSHLGVLVRVRATGWGAMSDMMGVGS